MLSSRKEENRLHIASPNTSHPTFASVGKVFDSLQGLQQRLDDFSLDDLSKAIETLEKAINIATQGGYGSSPEVQDFSFGLNQLKEKLVLVADLEKIFNNWEKNRLLQAVLRSEVMRERLQE